MMLQFSNEQDVQLPFSVEELAGRVVRGALSEEGWPTNVCVSLLLVDDGAISELNRGYRGISGPTDVLSFPALDLSRPLSPDRIVRGAGNIDPESGELILGDIVISVERAVAQAETYGHSVEREIAFLIAHSVLHLLGYDHTDEASAGLMEEKQTRILNKLGITRGT